MAAQTWTQLQQTFLAITVKAQPPYDPTTAPGDFAALLPQATSYAEQRIYTDIPFLGHRASNATLSTTMGKRTVSLSMMINSAGGPIIIPESLRLIAPVGSSPQSGTRVPFVRSSTFLIDSVWPIESTMQAPSLTTFATNYWAMVDAQTIIVAPTPDAAYVVEIDGLFQPAPISAANPATYLSTTYPALLEAACMVFLQGALMKNFGAQADNPQSALSWEALYQELMQSAKAEEARRRGIMPDIPMPSAGGAR
jgi:hypothetical protein